MKKISSLVLALVMCLGLCAPAFAASSDFTIEDGVLTKYNGPGGDVVIPYGVTRIGERAFYYCLKEIDVTIPDSVTSIGKWAFRNCEGLTRVIIPDSVTSIEEYAFCGCESLTHVTIPSSVISIETAAFAGCPSLTEIHVEAGDPNYMSVDGVLFSKNMRVLITYPGGREGGYVVPDGVAKIEWGAFADCEGLTNVTIPNSVAEIADGAFSGCYRLTDVYYTGTRAQWDAIQIDSANGSLTSANIHYVSDAPQEPPAVTVEAIPSSGTAYASTQTVTVDGRPVQFQMYALKDASGNGSNYIKLRDLAYVLNGTEAQFQVGYDGTVSLTTGQGYTASGTEMTTPFSGDRAYPTGGALSVKVDGRTVDMTAFTLVDDAGGGYNYFKLRDLGQVLGFNVYWADGQGVSIQTDRPYTGQAG